MRHCWVAKLQQMLPVLESLGGVVKSRGSELVRILNSIVMQFLLTADNEKKFKQKVEFTSPPCRPEELTPEISCKLTHSIPGTSVNTYFANLILILCWFVIW